MTVARRALTRGACLRLLVPGGHGRVATTAKAVPVIILVSFALLGEDIVFRLTSGDASSPVLADSVVAFETDELGPDRHAVWDVHVTGVAQPIADDAPALAFRLSSDFMSGWQVDHP